MPRPGTTRAEPLVILGAGMTGLAAGAASGGLVLEATDRPGGICASYYMTRAASRHDRRPADGDAYHFEVGGGHWIFGAGSPLWNMLRRRWPMKSFTRRSSVYFPERREFVAYPIQDNLDQLPASLSAKARGEIATARTSAEASTASMRDSLRERFGDTLCELFFDPFHRRYTADLWEQIAPQDAYKSPYPSPYVASGTHRASAHGYNARFAYPQGGLDSIACALASSCRIQYERRVTHIDTDARVVYCSDGSAVAYVSLLSTLALDDMVRMTQIQLASRADPATSVLVVNIGAARGPRCPDDHWVYVPTSRSGFHRVGFYSNVDPAFLPTSRSGPGAFASVYVEHAFRSEAPPGPEAAQRIAAETVRELTDWGWIGATDVIDATIVDPAYTWSWVGSTWVREALDALSAQSVSQLGRYGRWVFQGIADSITEGHRAGCAIGR